MGEDHESRQWATDTGLVRVTQIEDVDPAEGDRICFDTEFGVTPRYFEGNSVHLAQGLLMLLPEGKGGVTILGLDETDMGNVSLGVFGSDDRIEP